MTKHTVKAKSGFPVYIAGEPLNLTLYRERCRGDVRYAMTIYDPSGARQRRIYSTFEDAQEEAEKLNGLIHQGGWDLVTLRATERWNTSGPWQCSDLSGSLPTWRFRNSRRHSRVFASGPSPTS